MISRAVAVALALLGLGVSAATPALSERSESKTALSERSESKTALSERNESKGQQGRVFKMLTEQAWSTLITRLIVRGEAMALILAGLDAGLQEIELERRESLGVELPKALLLGLGERVELVGNIMQCTDQNISLSPKQAAAQAR